MTTILAFANEKGGVAKTTSALSLGGVLLEMGYEVLLVDLDPQANLTLALGLQPESIRRAAVDMLLNAAAPLGLSRQTELPGLDIIPGNGEMTLAERFLAVRSNHTLLLRNALQSIKTYDYILLDCPPALGAVTLNAISAAHHLIIPTQPEFFSAYALRNMLQTVQRLQQSENPNLQYHILITLFDARNRIHRSIKDQIYTRFGDRVFKTVIQLDTRLRESAVAGLPVNYFAANSRGAQQYRALAQELTHHAQENTAQSA